jgi:hypothetical protein
MSKKLKGFCLCCHIGSRDIQYTLEQLGHDLTIWSLSDHHSVMGWERKIPNIINHTNWWKLDQDMCDKFYERYKDELDKYDFFLTFYPPAFSMLYEKFNKPIISLVPLRYEIPFIEDIDKWNHLTKYFQEGIDKKRIIPLVNNRYDQVYLKLYTNRDWELISGLCDYTNAQYTSKRNEFLYCSKFEDFKSWLLNSNIVSKSQIEGYSWQDMADFKAIIHIPYNNITMSIFEQYTANIPLLFPSKEFLVQLWENYRGIMSEMSYRQTFKLSSGSKVKCEGHDPHDYNDLESFKYWSGLSDFYDEEIMPHIQYFDNISELEYLLLSLDFFEISSKMKLYNIEKKQKVMSQWKRVLDNIK